MNECFTQLNSVFEKYRSRANLNAEQQMSEADFYNALFLWIDPKRIYIGKDAISHWLDVNTKTARPVPKWISMQPLLNTNECYMQFSAQFDYMLEHSALCASQDCESMAAEMDRFNARWSLNAPIDAEADTLPGKCALALITALIVDYADRNVKLSESLSSILNTAIEQSRQVNALCKTPFLLNALLNGNASLFRYALNRISEQKVTAEVAAYTKTACVPHMAGIGDRYAIICKEYIESTHHKCPFIKMTVDEFALVKRAKALACIRKSNTLDELGFCLGLFTSPNFVSSTLSDMRKLAGDAWPKEEACLKFLCECESELNQSSLLHF